MPAAPLPDVATVPWMLRLTRRQTGLGGQPRDAAAAAHALRHDAVRIRASRGQAAADVLRDGDRAGGAPHRRVCAEGDVRGVCHRRDAVVDRDQAAAAADALRQHAEGQGPVGGDAAPGVGDGDVAAITGDRGRRGAEGIGRDAAQLDVDTAERRAGGHRGHPAAAAHALRQYPRRDRPLGHDAAGVVGDVHGAARHQREVRSSEAVRRMLAAKRDRQRGSLRQHGLAGIAQGKCAQAAAVADALRDDPGGARRVAGRLDLGRKK
ncbi:hypothetical protein G6F22_015712 [Rhizopus arrhizus]|nr:hypothetical protein G6F22_015712 [Rhizopus arrhizus]